MILSGGLFLGGETPYTLVLALVMDGTAGTITTLGDQDGTTVGMDQVFPITEITIIRATEEM